MAPIEPHTLVLGTHPSIASLSEEQYFGHPVNAFWWIAGDALGFRRAKGVGSSGKEYSLCQHLQYDVSHIIPYEKQIEIFVQRGFCLWDIVASCERPGSLDSDITREIPNDIQGFCESHPSIRRIVFANGGTGSTIFKRHFKEWLASGMLVPLTGHDASEKAFKTALQRSVSPSVVLITALSVSPAAARFSYLEKQQFWLEHVYEPGLEDWAKQQNAVT